MNYEQVVEYFKEKIFDHFAYSLGHRRIFFFGDNFTKPSGDYVVMKVATLNDIGWPTRVGFDVNGAEIQRQDYTITIDVVAYRGNPFATLSQIKRGSVLLATNTPLKENKIGFLSWGDIVDRTIDLDGVKFEKRASQTYTFSMRIETVDNNILEDIYSVEVTGTVDPTDPYSETISGP